MTNEVLLRITEPRLDSVKYLGFHFFRVFWIASYGFWLVFLSAPTPLAVRGLITLMLLIGLWLAWRYAKRWAQASLVLELTASHLSYSLTPQQRVKNLPLNRLTQIKYHRHLLMLEDNEGTVAQMHFPLKHRHYLADILRLLQQHHPHIQQTPV